MSKKKVVKKKVRTPRKKKSDWLTEIEILKTNQSIAYRDLSREFTNQYNNVASELKSCLSQLYVLNNSYRDLNNKVILLESKMNGVAVGWA